jgi:DNA-binding transcriptional LysR family regulator
LHFGRAASRHFIAAQPFGRHIQRIEREVGTRLFERTSRRVVVTPAGQRFVDQARTVLAQINELREVAADEPPTGDEPLRVGILGFGAGDRWPALREAVRIQAPGLTLEHYDLDFADQYDAVRLGRVDVAVVHYVGELDGLRFEPVLSSPRVTVVPIASPMADAEVLTLRELADYRSLNVAIREPSTQTWAGLEPVTAYPAVRYPAAIPTAVATTGRICLHAAAAAAYYPRPDVRFVPTEGPAVEIAVAVRSGDDRPAVAAFRRAAALARELAAA